MLRYRIFFYVVVFSSFIGIVYSNQDLCSFKRFQNASVELEYFSEDKTKLILGYNLTEAQSLCKNNTKCKAIFNNITSNLYYLALAEVTGLKSTLNVNNEIWLKRCPGDFDFRKIQEPYCPSYYEPIVQGTNISVMAALSTVHLKTDYEKPPKRKRAFESYYSDDIVFKTQDLIFTRKSIKLPKNTRVESPFSSWCTDGQCIISPRTYFHPVSKDLSFIGFTDDNGLGHIYIINEEHEVLNHIKPNFNGKHGAVAGVYGFPNKQFAVALFIPSTELKDRLFVLQLYRVDTSVQWQVILNSAISVPDRNAGDFRLTYGGGYFAVYFTVFGVANFANGTNGEQLSFVNELGRLMPGSFKVPGQKFIKTGDMWGCSHALGQLINYHKFDEQFITICTSDLFPKGISIGDYLSGTLLYESEANGKGSTTAQLGQIAHRNKGWNLIFSAKKAPCCEGRGIGLITIYNDIDEITGLQSFDDVTWLTNTKGGIERDPVIARFHKDSLENHEKEFYFVGWYNKLEDQFYLAVINAFGKFVKKPFCLTQFKMRKQKENNQENKQANCGGGSCISWGNRDDSLHTLYDGSVGWLTFQNKQYVSVIKVSTNKLNDYAGWSSWTSWSLCSKSCGDGTRYRWRQCLSDNRENCTEEDKETKPCNTVKCKIPVTCEFEFIDGAVAKGDLYLDGRRQYGYSIEEAMEKCKYHRDVCNGISMQKSQGFEFFFLKTSNETVNMAGYTFTMHCKETPGWSSWSLWFACSVTCGGGTKIRTRFCDGAEEGSKVCQGEKREETTCNTGKCPYWSEWSSWNACSVTCNAGFQNRTRICLGDYPASCDDLIGPHSENQPCNPGVCPYWSKWSLWSSCDTTCDSGSRIRTRECMGDFPCPEYDTNILKETCNLGRCQSWSLWGSWGDCSVSCGLGGVRQRERECFGDFPQFCTETKQTEVCNENIECPKWVSWSEWSDCSQSCDQGEQSRERNCAALDVRSCFIEYINNTTLNGLKIRRDYLNKSYVETDYRECNFGRCSYWTKWSEWGQCSTSCNEGQQTRKRFCDGDFKEDCSGNSTEVRTCTLGTCGSWEDWSSWGPCSTSCGTGKWSRSRICVGDFKNTCQGVDSETRKCNVGDCIVPCSLRPCQNEGSCRANNFLTREYFCECKRGWGGRHCTYASPALQCGRESITVELDPGIISSEYLPKDPKYIAFSAQNHIPECTATFLQLNQTKQIYLVVLPSPLDTSCGSVLEATDDEYKIHNKVVWQAVDGAVRSKIILLQFTCIYERSVVSSTIDSSLDVSLSVKTFRRNLHFITDYGNFEVNINLFRDKSFKVPISESFSGAMMQLAEGELFYVSVSLLNENSTEIGDETKLVMNTCFVTSSSLQAQSGGDQESMMYLIKDRCPVSAFVKVISNGEDKNGRFSVRVFGWTGRRSQRSNVYIHCTVEVCDPVNKSCKPDCNKRDKRSISENKVVSEKQTTAAIQSNNPHLHIIQTVNVKPQLADLHRRKNVSIDVGKMISMGPFIVKLKLAKDLRQKRALKEISVIKAWNRTIVPTEVTNFSTRIKDFDNETVKTDDQSTANGPIYWLISNTALKELAPCIMIVMGLCGAILGSCFIINIAKILFDRRMYFERNLNQI